MELQCKINGHSKCIALAIMLITTDGFDDFAEAEGKIKQNSETAFVVKLLAASLAGELRMLNDLKKSGSKIERP